MTNAAAVQSPSQKKVIVFLGLAIVVNALTWGVLLWKVPYTGNTVFLHYNIYFGIDLAGEWKQLLLMPGSGTLILVVNTVLVYLGRQLNHFLKIVTMSLTVVLQIMLFIATFLIVLLNS